MLTHTALSKELGYESLLSTYKEWGRYGQAKLLKKEDPYSEFLAKVEELINLYDNKKYGAFLDLLGKRDFKISKHSDKKELKNILDTLKDKRLNSSVAEVIKYVIEKGLLSKTKKMEEFELILLIGIKIVFIYFIIN